jgi:hypothetical protein
MESLLHIASAENSQYNDALNVKLDMTMADNTDAQHADRKHIISIKEKLDSLLQLTDATQCINEELLIAFRASREEMLP